MVRFFMFFFLMYNAQCLNGDSEKIPSDSSQTHYKNYGAISMDFNGEAVKTCGGSEKNCSDLNFECMKCNYTSECIYGASYTIKCNVSNATTCLGEREFSKIAQCRYCYQTEKWEHTCVLKHHCIPVSSPPQYYKTNCTVHGDVICFGLRTFPKKLRCNWTRGHKWSTAFILSITLGGFGADRFYLGHWQEGIGKLFSFGGLGVWTLVDVLLIAIRYLGPADGSFYV